MSSFDDDLVFSDGHEDTLRLAYEYLFPEAAFLKNGEDNRAQRAGVDRVLVKPNGDTIKIDEKLRRRVYERDILLEYVSNTTTESPGWICKPNPIDYLHNVYLPVRLGVLIGWPMLKKAWGAHGHTWIKHYRPIVGRTDLANGRHYNTMSVAVPDSVLIEAGCNLTKYQIPFPKTIDTPLPASPPKSGQGNLFG